MVDAGRIGFVIKGDYNRSTTYEVLDVVFYPSTGCTYIAKGTTVGHEPTDATYWQVIADGASKTNIVEKDNSDAVTSGGVYEALQNISIDSGNLENATVNTFETTFTTDYPQINAGLTMRQLIGRIKKNISSIISNYIPKSGGDVSATTINTFAESTDTLPVPRATDTVASAMGKIVKWFTDFKQKFDNVIARIIAPVENTTSTSKSYSVGDYFVFNETLYKVIQSIPKGGTISVGTNCTQTTITELKGQSGWSGTTAEWNAIKDNESMKQQLGISEGTQINITDDYGEDGKVNTSDVLTTLSAVTSNTDATKIANANVVKELNNHLNNFSNMLISEGVGTKIVFHCNQHYSEKKRPFLMFADGMLAVCSYHTYPSFTKVTGNITGTAVSDESAKTVTYTLSQNARVNILVTDGTGIDTIQYTT